MEFAEATPGGLAFMRICVRRFRFSCGGVGWGVHTYADQPHTFVRRASGSRCGRYGAASSHGCSGQRPPPPSHSGVPVSSDGAAVLKLLLYLVNPIKARRGHGGKFPRILDVACALRSRTRHTRGGPFTISTFIRVIAKVPGSCIGAYTVCLS